LVGFSPDIIAFTSMTVDYGKIIGFAKKIREKFDVPFILGGVHISTLPQSLDKVFDVGVIGEGEKTFAELIEIYLKKGSLSANEFNNVKGVVFFDGENLKINLMREPIVNLDDLPIPDFKFANSNYFSFSVRFTKV